jgi:dipeptidyl aminopeptidase/acylaminoacyl peptidase
MKQDEKHRGFRPRPIQPAEITREVSIADVQWNRKGEGLVWLETGPKGQGLLAQHRPGFELQDLTLGLNVKAGLGYGGGDFGLGNESVFFVADGRIYRKSLKAGRFRVLTPPWGDIAAPTPDPAERSLLYVHSFEGRDVLAFLSLERSGWPIPLVSGADFYMQPTWSPDGKQLAWVCWNHPNMPWDGTALQVADIDVSSGVPILSRQRTVAGDPEGSEAVFQPSFSPDGKLLSFVSDRSGWMNLQVVSSRDFSPVASFDEEAEHARPAWLQGMRTYGWNPSGRSLYVIRSHRGIDTLVQTDLEHGIRPHSDEELAGFTSLEQISVSEEGILLIASSTNRAPALLWRKSDHTVSVLRHTRPRLLEDGYFQEPKPLQIPVEGGCCHGFFYRPSHPGRSFAEPFPLIVKVHGGPTACSDTSFDLENQFFTSRGWAVFALNHRGSSGFGKKYLTSLYGGWGETEVEDVGAAADYLADRKLADPKRLVIMGGSAGGFTALHSLIRYPGRFRAAVCRYPVADLTALTRQTHKFERNYLDRLIGPLPEAADEYRERSPLLQASRIKDPVAVFQGAQDQVVARSQVEQLVRELNRQQVPHLYHVFEDEGHGWKRPETIRVYFSKVEEFLSRYVPGV